jgi:two-component system, cell cycle sensor histidine kinase and response regulator CckA
MPADTSTTGFSKRKAGESGKVSIHLEGSGVERLNSESRYHSLEEKRLAQLETLRQASLSLTASLDLEEVLNTIARCTLDLIVGAKNCHIFLYFPEEGGRLVFGGALWDDGSKSQAFAQPRTDGLTFTVARSGKAILVPDMGTHPLYKDAPSSWIGSIVGLPLMIGDRVVGVMNVSHARSGAFDEADLRMLRLLGDQAAIAIENARLYEQVHQLADLLAGEQKRLEKLIERLPAGIILLDENYRIELINSFGRELLALLRPEAEDQTIERLGSYSIEELVQRSEDPQPVEIEFKGPPARTFEVETCALGDEGRHWVLMLRDVSQERQNQVRVQMQERLATVGQLAAGIAHDFNNIMATILVYTDLLAKDLAGNQPSRDRLDIIHQQVQRAASLIRQILDFSRRSVLEHSTLDLLPFIKEFDKLLVRVLPETIKVDLIYQPGSYYVNADPTRLQQVLMNLALNARDAMQEGGTLRFDLSRLLLRPGDHPPSPYLLPGDWIVIKVSDTGAGITSEVTPHIFEPFFTTKPVGQGTGLGLAQAYGIVKQHGGYIDVQSHPGKWTSFSIFLPALEVVDTEIDPDPPRSLPEGKGQRILVVEDDKVTLDAIRDLLEAQNYTVATASNGLEALQLFELDKNGFSLVVSDVVMPEMGGVAMYAEVSKRWPEVKVLFVTGHPLEEESQALLEESGVPWLQKPFSVPDFFQSIESLLGSAN